MAKIQRKYYGHYVQTADGTLVRLGKDLESYTAKLSSQVEKTRNILGETSVILSGSTKSAAVGPFYAEPDDPLFQQLQAALDGGAGSVETQMVEVKLWQKNEDGSYPAVRESAYLTIDSYGGDTTGYQIGFTVHYTGEKTVGTFADGTFTPETGA